MDKTPDNKLSYEDGDAVLSLLVKLIIKLHPSDDDNYYLCARCSELYSAVVAFITEHLSAEALTFIYAESVLESDADLQAADRRN